MADQNRWVGRKELSAISEVTRSNSFRCNSMKSERKAVICRSRSEVRNTGDMISEEEAKIRAELAKEIEKTLQVEIEQQISTLTRRLQELRHQTKSDIPVKKPDLTKGVLPKNNSGGAERKKKFEWESSLRSESSSESGSFRRRPWNDGLSNSSSWRCTTVGKGKENCRCAERKKNRLLGAIVAHNESSKQSFCSTKLLKRK
ncbi:hypothetical protein SUGI_1170460 [Cryptomeria japonica]|nr:hypothetical protein SUGI_1170460 [Cryptomeria japonica]